MAIKKRRDKTLDVGLENAYIVLTLGGGPSMVRIGMQFLPIRVY